MTRLVFVDTETTGLDPERREIWELAAIVRDPGESDVEYEWQFRPTMVGAEPTGLRIGRYYQRSLMTGRGYDEVLRTVHPDYPGVPVTDYMRLTVASSATAEIARLLDGAHLVGAVPWFDERSLQKLLAQNGQALTAHYHLIDIEALMVGYLAGRARANLASPEVSLPWKPDDLSKACGVEPMSNDQRHTALGDARWARNVYDAVMGGQP